MFYYGYTGYRSYVRPSTAGKSFDSTIFFRFKTCMWQLKNILSSKQWFNYFSELNSSWSIHDWKRQSWLHCYTRKCLIIWCVYIYIYILFWNLLRFFLRSIWHSCNNTHLLTFLVNLTMKRQKNSVKYILHTHSEPALFNCFLCSEKKLYYIL